MAGVTIRQLTPPLGALRRRLAAALSASLGYAAALGTPSPPPLLARRRPLLQTLAAASAVVPVTVSGLGNNTAAAAAVASALGASPPLPQLNSSLAGVFALFASSPTAALVLVVEVPYATASAAAAGAATLGAGSSLQGPLLSALAAAGLDVTAALNGPATVSAPLPASGCAASGCFSTGAPLFLSAACSLPNAVQAAAGQLAACGACPAGWEGDGRNCTWVDPCLAPPTATKAAPCQAPTQCVSTYGLPGHTCTPCPAGMRGAGGRGCYNATVCAVNNGGCDKETKCFDGDAALPQTGGFVSGGGAAAAAVNGTSTCGACPYPLSGTGDTECVPTDFCAAGPCAPGVACTNTDVALLRSNASAAAPSSSTDSSGAGGVAPYSCGACPPGTAGDGETCAACPLALSFPPSLQSVPQSGAVRRSAPVSLSAQVGPISALCNVGSGISFTWALFDGLASRPIRQPNAPALLIPPRTLSAGAVASVVAQACPAGAASAASCATAAFSFAVESSPLVAVIDGGNVAVTGQQAAVTLSAARSVDPDDPGGSLGSLNYSWSCASGPLHPLGALAPATAGGSAATEPAGGAPCLTSTGAAFAPAANAAAQAVSGLRPSSPGSAYFFTVTVSKAGRSASTTATVVVADAPAAGPVVSLRPPSATGVINPQFKTTIAAAVASASPASLRTTWSLIATTDPSADIRSALNLSSPAVVASPPGSASLVLQPNATKPGVSYVLQLTATDDFGVGTANVTIVAGAGPTGTGPGGLGTLLVSPPLGTALLTNFTVSTANVRACVSANFLSCFPFSLLRESFRK